MRAPTFTKAEVLALIKNKLYSEERKFWTSRPSAIQALRELYESIDRSY